MQRVLWVTYAPIIALYSKRPTGQLIHYPALDECLIIVPYPYISLAREVILALNTAHAVGSAIQTLLFDELRCKRANLTTAPSGAQPSRVASS